MSLSRMFLPTDTNGMFHINRVRAASLQLLLDPFGLSPVAAQGSESSSSDRFWHAEIKPLPLDETSRV